MGALVEHLLVEGPARPVADGLGVDCEDLGAPMPHNELPCLLVAVPRVPVEMLQVLDDGHPELGGVASATQVRELREV